MARRDDQQRALYLQRMRDFALLGFTDRQIAAELEVSYVTFSWWKANYEEFKIALREGGAIADANVTNKVYDACVGYYYEEEELDSYGNVVKVKKYQKPDPAIAMKWLAKRQRELWQDTTKVELGSGRGGSLQVNDAGAEALWKELEKRGQVVEIECIDAAPKALPEVVEIKQ